MSIFISYLNFQGLLLQVGTVHRTESDFFPLRRTLFSILLVLIWVKELQKPVEDGVAVRVYNPDTQRASSQEQSQLGALQQAVDQTGVRGACVQLEKELVSCRHISFPHATFLKRYIWNTVNNGDHRGQDYSCLYIISSI